MVRRLVLLVLAAVSVPVAPAIAQVSGGVAQPDASWTVSLDLASAGNTFNIPIGNGQGVVGIDITGLTGSGATVVAESTVGSLWVPTNMLIVGTGGALSSSLSVDGSFRMSSAAKRTMRLRVSVAGTGTASLQIAVSANSSLVQLAAPLPPGGNALGSVSISNFPATQAVTGPLAVTDNAGSLTVDTGTPGTFAVTPGASFPVTGTFWQATQPVSAAALPLPAGAATAANQAALSAQIPASLGAKTTANSLAVTLPTDMAALATTTGPSSAAASAIAPATATAATSLLVRNSAGNFYSGTVSAGTVGGFMIVANLAAVPSSGASLSGVVLHCVPVAPNQWVSVGAPVPDRASTGVVILFSTSCGTYTPVGTVATFLRGRAA